VTELEQLLAREQVREVVLALFDWVDQGEWALVAGLFADEVRWDLTAVAGGSPRLSDPDELVGAWSEALAHLDAYHYQVGGVRAFLDSDDHARASCGTLMAEHLLGEGTRVYAGSWRLGLVRSGARWVVGQVVYQQAFSTTSAPPEDDELE